MCAFAATAAVWSLLNLSDKGTHDRVVKTRDQLCNFSLHKSQWEVKVYKKKLKAATSFFTKVDAF